MVQLRDRSRSSSCGRNKVISRSYKSREEGDNRNDKTQRSRSKDRYQNRSRHDRSRSQNHKTRRDRSRSRSHKTRRDRSRPRSHKARHDRSRSRSKERRHNRKVEKSSFRDTRRHKESRGRSNDRRIRRSSDEAKHKDLDKAKTEVVKAVKRKAEQTLNIAGAYIPPQKLRMMQAKIDDKTSIEYQKIAWEALKKTINGLTNKVSQLNVTEVCMELFQENIVRGRGLLVKSLIQSQAAALPLTPVFAALAAVLNSKFPQIGKLLLDRLTLNFRRGFKRNLKQLCLASAKFIAHLYNQNVVEDILPLEILLLLLNQPTNDSVEIAIGLLKECGKKLTEDSETSVMVVFNSLNEILLESKNIDDRVAYMIETMYAIRKDNYNDFPIVVPELELIENEEQFMHRIEIDEELQAEERLNVFGFDNNYEENEAKFETIKNELLGINTNGDEEDVSDDSGDDDGDDDDDSETEEGGEKNGENKNLIIDQTETNLKNLRKNIFLAFQSCVSSDEIAHKLIKMQIKPGQELELHNMMLDCCAQNRMFDVIYPKVSEKLWLIHRNSHYESIFKEQYENIHRQESQQITNTAKFFAYLFYSDVISWEAMECVKLNENDSTSSSRIFVKHLFGDISMHMGISNMKERFNDPSLRPYFEGIFPLNNSNDTRFAINLLTHIKLGALTDDMREHLNTSQRDKRKG